MAAMEAASQRRFVLRVNESSLDTTLISIVAFEDSFNVLFITFLSFAKADKLSRRETVGYKTRQKTKEPM